MARDDTDKPKQQRRTSREFNFMGFLWRFIASLFLVLISYNPTRYSYWDWVITAMNNEPSTLGPEHFVVGVVLMIGWVILLAATQRSLGVFGLMLGAMLLGGVVWLLVDIGWLSVSSVTSASWVALVSIALLLAVGLSWSHVWRRLTGQFEVDDGDN